MKGGETNEKPAGAVGASRFFIYLINKPTTAARIPIPRKT
jgi:hypothetical protein